MIHSTPFLLGAVLLDFYNSVQMKAASLVRWLLRLSFLLGCGDGWVEIRSPWTRQSPAHDDRRSAMRGGVRIPVVREIPNRHRSHYWRGGAQAEHGFGAG